MTATITETKEFTEDLGRGLMVDRRMTKYDDGSILMEDLKLYYVKVEPSAMP